MESNTAILWSRAAKTYNIKMADFQISHFVHFHPVLPFFPISTCYKSIWKCLPRVRRPWLWLSLDSDGNDIAQCQHQTNGGRDSPQIRHCDTVTAGVCVENLTASNDHCDEIATTATNPPPPLIGAADWALDIRAGNEHSRSWLA